MPFDVVEVLVDVTRGVARRTTSQMPKQLRHPRRKYIILFHLQ